MRRKKLETRVGFDKSTSTKEPIWSFTVGSVFMWAAKMWIVTERAGGSARGICQAQGLDGSTNLFQWDSSADCPQVEPVDHETWTRAEQQQDRLQNVSVGLKGSLKRLRLRSL